MARVSTGRIDRDAECDQRGEGKGAAPAGRSKRRGLQEACHRRIHRLICSREWGSTPSGRERIGASTFRAGSPARREIPLGRHAPRADGGCAIRSEEAVHETKLTAVFRGWIRGQLVWGFVSIL